MKDYIACVLFLFVFDDLNLAYPNIERKDFFQLFCKLLFFNDSFFVVSCFVLVVGDSFLIRSIKKFFCFVYLLARVCLGARTWACVCAYVCACMRVRVRVGVTFVQH